MNGNSSDSATFSKKLKSILKWKVFLIRNFVFGGFPFIFESYMGLFLARENTIPLVLVSNIIVFHYEERTGFMEEHGGNFHHIVLKT